jgi:hypothetical protein
VGRLQCKIAENQIAEIWQQKLLDNSELVTEDGKAVKIIYPGRLNNEQGADFSDAVIAVNKELIRGDVEIHVRSGDWRNHKHHLDPVYNRVVLHVVMWHNGKEDTRLQNGRKVPVLALDKYIKIPVSQWRNSASGPAAVRLPCTRAAHYLDTSTIIEFLDKAGEERFLGKAARFQRELAQIGASQSLYCGVMEALGYSKNKLPFLELARRLPLRILESAVQGKISDGERLGRQQALLLGTAGLLSTRCRERFRENTLDSEWMDRLERIWDSSGQVKAMPSDAWHLFKVRPNNSPIRRLMAMSCLLLRYREKGLLEGLLGLVGEVPVSRGYYKLKRGLLVNADDCRTDHFGFNTAGGMASPTLLGNERAADITVNVLLPFSFAWSRVVSRPELEKKALDLYHLYPRLAENSIERHMAHQLGLRRGLVSLARWQQGLIHIYNNLCTQGRCGSCPLGQLQAGDHV